MRDVAKRLQNGLRSNVDWMVRFGGEEFVIFLPETHLCQALEVANRLLEAMRQVPWKRNGLALDLTCSFGVTQFVQGDSMDSLLHRADSLLYQAKKQGRNRVCVSDAAMVSAAGEV